MKPLLSRLFSNSIPSEWVYFLNTYVALFSLWIISPFVISALVFLVLSIADPVNCFYLNPTQHLPLTNFTNVFNLFSYGKPENLVTFICEQVLKSVTQIKWMNYIQMLRWQSWQRARPTIERYRSTVAHWYVICFSPGGPGFKSRQGTIFQNKNERRNVWITTL